MTRVIDELSAGQEPISGSIAVPGEEARFTFALATDTFAYFDGLTPGFKASLDGPEGNVFNNIASGDEVFLPVPKLVAGDYTLTIGGEGDQTGAYQFRVRNLSSAIPVSPGSTVNGTLSPATETDIYTFDAAAGDRFNFRALSAETFPRWRLLGPLGREVFSNSFATVNALTLTRRVATTCLSRATSATRARAATAFTSNRLAALLSSRQRALL